MKKLLSLILAAVLVIAGCSSGSGDGEGTSYTISNGEIESMNPTQATFTNTFSAISYSYSMLYRVDNNFDVVPDMASELPEISEDGMTYTIKLVEDRKWLDNEGNEVTDVTANDFVTAWTAGAQGEYAFIYQDFTKDGTVNVKALDDYTLEIKLNYVAPYFTELLALGMFAPVPTEFFEAQGDQYGKTAETTYSNGAYYLSAMDISTKLSFQKSDQPGIKYNNKIETVDMPVIEDTEAAYNSFLGNELDIAAVPPAQYEEMKDEDNVYTTPQAGTYFMNYMTEGGNSGYMDSVNLRKALNYSLNREELANNVVKRGVVPFYNLIPKDLTASSEVGDYSTNYATEYTSYDPEKALEELEKFLEDEGLSSASEVTLDLVMSDAGTNGAISEKVKSDIESNLGISINIRLLPTENYYMARDDGDFDLVFSGWNADYADPTNFLGLFTSKSADSGVSSTKYRNEDYDKLYEEILAEGDLDTRFTLSAEAEKKIVEEDAVIMPLFQNTTVEINNNDKVEYVKHSYQKIPLNYWVGVEGN